MSIMSRFSLAGRTALVTGGARGIGLATSTALAEGGAAIILVDRDGEAAENAAAQLRERGFDVVAYPLDVTRSADVTALADRYSHVDILVNNAGIARSNIRAEDMTDDEWTSVVDINLNGMFWCCRAFGRHMLERGRGAIVNVGSMSGFVVNRPQEQAQYNASKAAVHQLTRSLAAEWAPRGVRVNAVAPTYIETEMTRYVYDSPELMQHWIGGTPQNRMGQPDEIAAVILFLASDAASLMTGSIVLADGGYTCW
ncbi:SDR family NAD(P)-dependent oxidoreductase [Aureimonas frigidaquae]|uniref:Short-chain dehydrogenase/reductase SDR n=1 Tax=Aureimonas frigidaquae TaxID=424757 RepID=A0A0P0Z410_9HYPH|nr:glucose 1-dehydrogenase [Aureimonas frigidaquae]BAT28835.1 short-chain dehydrogenase/reductase SDR [Aureimonas frigidaquae]